MSKEALYTTHQAQRTHQTQVRLNFGSRPKNILLLIAVLSIASFMLSVLAPTLPPEILFLVHIVMASLLLLMLVMYYRYFRSQSDTQNEATSQDITLRSIAKEDDKHKSPANNGLQEQLTQLDTAAQALQVQHRLTQRETEIMVLIGQGRSKRYISERLYISENTVRGHVKNIYIKCGVHNKQQLINQLESAA